MLLHCNSFDLFTCWKPGLSLVCVCANSCWPKLDARKGKTIANGGCYLLRNDNCKRRFCLGDDDDDLEGVAGCL